MLYARINKTRVKTGFSRQWLRLCAVFICGLLSAAHAEEHKVLVLHSYHPNSWNGEITAGIASVFDQREDVSVRYEYMDTKWYATPEYLEQLRVLYTHKYSNTIFDVVIACDDNAYTFARTHHLDLFNGVPLVFCGVSDFNAADIEGCPITGIMEIEPYQDSLTYAMHLLPNTRTVYVLADRTRTAQHHLKRIRDFASARFPGLEIKTVEQLTHEQLTELLEQLPSDTICVAVGWWIDNDGALIHYEQFEAILARCNRPVFGVAISSVKKGAMIGGRCISGEYQGRVAAEMVERIMDDRISPASLPVQMDSIHGYPNCFNLDLIKRHGLEQRLLPNDTVLFGLAAKTYEVPVSSVQLILIGGIVLLLVSLLIIASSLCKRRLQKKLFVQLEHFRRIVETTSDWLWEVDINGHYTYVSPQISRILGYLPEDILGKTPFDLMPPEEARRLESVFLNHLNNKAEFRNLENVNLHKDGRRVVLETNGVPILDAKGKLTGYRGIDRDITNRIQADNALRENEEKYRRIFHCGSQGFFLMSDVFLDCNEEVCNLWGCTRKDVIGHSPAEFSPKLQPDGRRSEEAAKEYIQAALSGEPQRFYWQHLRKDGILIDCEIMLDTVVLNQKTFLLATMVNITDRKESEQALAESEQRFRNIVESSPMGIHTYELKPDGKLIMTGANPAAAKFLNRNLTDQIGKTIEEVYPPLTETDIPDIYRRLCRDGGSYYGDTFEYKDTDVEGYYEFTAFQTSPGKMATMFLDVTKSVQTQQMLRFTQFATDHSVEAAYWMDEKGCFVYVNEKACQTLGYTHEELMTMTVFDISVDFHKDDWPDAWKRLKDVRTMQIEIFHKRKDGTVFPVEVTGNFVEYDGREYNCAFARDITENKAAEQKRDGLVQQLRERNDELQSIVFTAAHDLRSPLVNIAGFTGELEKGLSQLADTLSKENLTEPVKKEIDFLFKTDMAESLKLVKAGSQQMDMLLNGLMRLSRVGSAPLAFKALDMNDLLDSVVDGLQFQVKEYRVDVSVKPNLPECLGDATLLGQVFTNLFDNAIKYRHPERDPKIEVSAHRLDDMVEYAVSDNGIGIDAAHLEKVFELFHRLGPKQQQQDGEGLGLTIVRRILDRHDGSVRIDSIEHQGTTVHVRIPVA